MSGGKGGGQSTKTEIPEWAEAATKRNLARAEEVQKIGYMPYYGPDVAGFTPTQQDAMANNLAAASAFGMAAPSDPMAGMPQAQDFGGGMSGYSSGGLFDQAVAEFERRKPAYAKEYNELFAGENTYKNPYLDFGFDFGDYFAPINLSGPSGLSAPQSRPSLRDGRVSTPTPRPSLRDGRVSTPTPPGMPNFSPEFNTSPVINLPPEVAMAPPMALPSQLSMAPPAVSLPPQGAMTPPQAPLDMMPPMQMPIMGSNLMDLPIPQMEAPMPTLNYQPAAPKANIDDRMKKMRTTRRMK
jgi:hypothetical protein